MPDSGQSLDERTIDQLIESTTQLAIQRKEKPLPPSEHVTTLVENMREVLFPGSVGLLDQPYERNVKSLVKKVSDGLTTMIHTAQSHESPSATPQDSRDIALHVLRSLEEIRALLRKDLQAALLGDPAALNEDNVLLSYPGFKAITIQRIAHLLHQQHVPLLPRQMTEYAHRETGIDIHPGAAIGEGFFIDHGTGVVIGETTIIGNNVRLYQGVTLGASTDPVKAGRTQRHPTLKDNVTCFAGSGVFGPITIHENVTIGAGAEVYEDVLKNSIVQSPKTALTVREKKKK